MSISKALTAPPYMEGNQEFSEWISNLYDIFINFFPLAALGDSQGAPLSLFEATQLNDAQILTLNNVKNGMIIYNVSNNKFLFRENNAWVEKQNV